MNLKKIEKEIHKALNNLDSVKMTNKLKAEAIMTAIEPLLVADVIVTELEDGSYVSLRSTSDATN